MATTNRPAPEPTRTDLDARIAELEKKLLAAERALEQQAAAHKKVETTHANEIERLQKSHATRLATQERTLKAAQTAELARRDKAHATALASAEAAAAKAASAQAAELNRVNLQKLAMEDQMLKLVAEHDRLRGQIGDINNRLAAGTESAAKLAALEKALAELQKQNDLFLEENRRLAEALELNVSDTAVFREHAEQATLRIASELAREREHLSGQFRDQVASLAERARLAESRADSLSAQLAGDGRLAVIPPDQLGDLASRFIGQIETSLPGLRLSTGELKLKMGLAQSGGQTGFVVIGPGAPANLKDQLHDFSLKFDRALPGTNLRTAIEDGPEIVARPAPVVIPQ